MSVNGSRSSSIKNSISKDQPNNNSYGTPICPKPHHLRSALPEQFFNHSHQCNNHLQMAYDGNGGIIDIITADKVVEGCSKCLPEWTGSPPGRTDNPLIHDDNFLRIRSRLDFFPTYPPS